MTDELPFYVYRIFDGPVTLYVGKGCGERLNNQKRRFKAEGEIIERCETDGRAFARERHWIALLSPTENKSSGGEGSITKGSVPAKQDRNIVRGAAIILGRASRLKTHHMRLLGQTLDISEHLQRLWDKVDEVIARRGLEWTNNQAKREGVEFHP